ncbi:MAG: hypothetical protein FPO08_01075 [Geobacter sp.]|nr:MAG: hypothetical protein FPO08_01075 [Geobacter sp.]
MQTRARFHEIENFGSEGQYNKGIFLDMDTMDKVGVMLSDKQVKDLAPHVGKDGVLTVGLSPSGYDYSVKYKSFKVAA